jgi:hypothetical protein
LIDGEVSPDQILDLPMVEAMNFLAMMVWLERVKDSPKLTIAEVMQTPFRQVLEIIIAAETETAA